MTCATDLLLTIPAIARAPTPMTTYHAATWQGIYSYTLEPTIFADGFETGDTSAWSSAAP